MPKTRKPAANIVKPSSLLGYDHVLQDVVGLLASARHATARIVNAAMTATYWQIGRRIVEWEQEGKERSDYGEQLLEKLASDLTPRFGRGFGRENLRLMRKIYLSWPPEISRTPSGKSLPQGDNISQTVSGKSNKKPNTVLAAMLQTPSEKSVAPLNRQTVSADSAAPLFPLPWSHYVRLLTVKNPEGRKFYETEALRGGWSVRQLDRQINSLFYERTALSKNKAAMLIKGGKSQPADEVTAEEQLKDPFVLEFLGLKDEYSETQLEEALIRHLETFLLESGGNLAFVGRQRRLRVGDHWYRIDLLFFHRKLRCLVVIDLKAGEFSHADAGQMHLYLNFAAEHWTYPGENPPVGLILCAEKDTAVAHYALDNLPNKILAAEYKMALPDATALAAEITKTRRILESRNLLRPR
jgi:predicted nuclease of restriction endonuclease-like (RecB) superfamily